MSGTIEPGDGSTPGKRATVEECLAALGPVVSKLLAEVHPTRRSAPNLSPESSLERDLGFDSLSRVELMVRVEEAFRVRLPSEVAARVETMGELARVVQAADDAGVAVDLARVAMPAEAMQDLPVGARTVIDVLDWHASRHGDRTQVWLHEDDESITEITFSDLVESAERVAAGLLERDLERGQAVAIMLPTCRGFFSSFYGILLAGGVPVPLYPPVRMSQLEDHLRRQAAILATAGAPFLITVPEAKRLGMFLRSQVPSLRGLVTVEEISSSTRYTGRPTLDPEDTAFLQFTSGSTGDPKGVVLSHANLLTNVRVIGSTVGPWPEDVFVSWLPLYHDMGLIGAVLATTYLAIPLVLMSPLAFLSRPERWLRAIHRHRGSLTAAPNFAFELCVKKIPDEALEGLDLSSWRVALNGAEPISPGTMKRFADRFARCGFRENTMTPTYGLAECSLALAMTPVDRKPLVDRIDRDVFSSRGRATPTDAREENALEFVSCGAPLSGHEIRIVDSSGNELPERREGRLQFRGPSATRGYFRNPGATAHLVQDHGWLDSGDLAYMAGGEVYLTGRVKDVIIRAGRNIYPHELEEAVGALPGIRKGCVAVFGAQQERDATEVLVVLAETRETDEGAREELRQKIRELAVDLLDEAAVEIALAPTHTVLKTSSGKIRRAACRQLWEDGKIGGTPRAAWMQLARLTARGWLFSARLQAVRAGEALYAGWFWASVSAGTAAFLVPVAVLPTRKLRWAATRASARLALRLAGVYPEVDGKETLRANEPVVFIANHSSYADNLVTAAVLPDEVAVVAKRELEDKLFTRFVLGRLGVIFVERFRSEEGAHGSNELVRALAEGRSLLVYPEGTCLRMAGLLPFRSGAFQAAAEAGVPVIPLTIRGTRSLLRPTTWFPRRNPLRVKVGDPLRAVGRGWSAAMELRDRARKVILTACGEPDLAGEDAVEHLERLRIAPSRGRKM